MRIEVTYIDDSEPKKGFKLRLPKRRNPRPSPLSAVKPPKRAKRAKMPVATKQTKSVKSAKTPASAKSPKPAQPRQGLPKPIRNVLASAAVLLLLFIGAGVLYTMFADGGPVPVATASMQPDASSASGEIKPHKPAPNVPESAAVEMITSPVTPGVQASVSVHTNPTSVCTVAVIYDYHYEEKQTPVSDPSLGKQTADDFGMVSWNWTVSPAAPLGLGKVTVKCIYHDRSAAVEASLQVAKN